jgi:exosortase A-associated hydrolase 2
MVTLQAQALAQLGFGTLLVDLHGTGDSQGLYRDARWSTWLDDLHAAHAWLQARPGGCRALWGIRLGAILAAQLHVRLARPELALALWQPVIDGKQHLNQFLRVRMAAQLDRPNLPKETTTSMRQQLAAGEPLEVAGYEIHPELATAIDAARLTDHALQAAAILWLDSVSPDNPELSLPTRAAAEAWAKAGVRVEPVAYSGPAFWQVHERVVTPSIIEKTTHWFAGRAAP